MDVVVLMQLMQILIKISSNHKSIDMVTGLDDKRYECLMSKNILVV